MTQLTHLPIVANRPHKKPPICPYRLCNQNGLTHYQMRLKIYHFSISTHPPSFGIFPYKIHKQIRSRSVRSELVLEEPNRSAGRDCRDEAQIEDHEPSNRSTQRRNHGQRSQFSQRASRPSKSRERERRPQSRFDENEAAGEGHLPKSMIKTNSLKIKRIYWENCFHVLALIAQLWKVAPVHRSVSLSVRLKSRKLADINAFLYSEYLLVLLIFIHSFIHSFLIH